MIAQTAGRADHDMGAGIQRPGFSAGIHAADAGDDACAGFSVQPSQFAVDLHGQLAGRRDDQSLRLGRALETLILPKKCAGKSQAERHRLARAGLRRDQ